MKIIHLKLHLFSLLHLANIKTIEINPKSKTQVFLGSNGSGKSVLFSEHSPLPPDKDHFEKDGFKYIEILHKNNLYKLKCHFSDTATYSFIKNDVEQNPSLKITTYKELCKTEFGITPDIHELMTGKINFDQLDLKQRKNWITRISKIDYDYAFSYYKKLQERTRDVQGAIKNINSKLIQEKGKSISNKEMEDIEEKVKFLYSKLEEYRAYKKNPKASINQIISARNELLKNISNACKDLLKLKTYLTSSIETVKEKRQTLSMEESSTKTMIDYLMKKIDSASKEMQSIKSHLETNELLGDIERNSLVEAVMAKQLSLDYLKDANIPDVKKAQDNLKSCLSDIEFFLLEMKEYAEGRISHESYTEAKAKETSYKSRLEGIDAVARIYLKEIEYIEKHEHDDPLKCPNCMHSWNPNYNQQVLDEKKKKLNSLNEKKKELEDLERNIREEVKFIETERHLRSNFSAYISTYPDLNWYWNLYSKFKLMSAPKTALEVTYRVLEELKTVSEIHSLKKQLDAIKEKDSRSKEELKNKFEHLENEIKKNEQECRTHWDKLTFTKQELEKTNTIIKAHDRYLQLKEEVRSLLSKHKTYVEISLDHMRNAYLNECIDLLQKEIHASEQKLLKARNIHHVVQTLEEEISELENKHVVLKKACIALSPDKGLIAKGLKGFLDHFLPQVNSFIEQVWLYPMKIVVKENHEKGVEMDYKFQVVVKDAKPIEDISLVSKGMKEMINLAFRLASMPYLGLEDGCVFLDEYGANLDAKHKLSAYKVTKTLMESENYSQIYIASHFSEGYGELSNADFTVLCPNNIELPDKTYNETTLITYT